MCMNISKEDIVRIAKGFGGNLRNTSSLDFALGKQEEKKLGEYKKLAYLLRAILVDHPFSDGNKKTGMFVALAFAEEHNKQVDDELLKHHILSIASRNIIQIRAIEERIKNAIIVKDKGLSLNSQRQIVEKQKSLTISNKKIKEILEKYKQNFIEMEHYDKTREILWDRKRIDITLQLRIIKKLKEISAKTGKPVSRIIEESVIESM